MHSQSRYLWWGLFYYNCNDFIAGPVIINAPENQEVIFGEDVVFSCTSTAEPLHSVVWTFDGLLIANYNATSNTKYVYPSYDVVFILKQLLFGIIFLYTQLTSNWIVFSKLIANVLSYYIMY